MKKIKILGIAPYEGIQVLMRQIANQREDIQLDTYIGDLQKGADIATEYQSNGYDAIISRGGTADLIRQTAILPVIDISLSVYDIFRSIKLAENYTSKYALVGFPNITKNAHFLCDMLQHDINIFTIHNEQEAENVLAQLSSENYNMVVCDMITNSLAKKYGMTSILITSGGESIETAFDLAIEIVGFQHSLKEENRFFKSICEHHPWDTIIFQESGDLLYSSKITILDDCVMELLRFHIPNIINDGEKKICQEISGLLYVFQGCRTDYSGKPCVTYYINRRKVPLALTKNGIFYITKEDAYDKFFNSFYGITHSTANLGMSIEQYADSKQPLMIIGEPGTGKEPLARLIFAKSNFQNKPMAIVDCGRIGTKGWEFLTGHDNSPLSDTNMTLYIKNIHVLTEAQFEELLSIIKDLGLTHRNRLIFTYLCNADASYDERCIKLQNLLSCLTLHIPPLRSHLNDIPNLASLYISSLNMKMAKEIIGLEPKALSLLQSYDWPSNYDQFRRILNELVTMTLTPFIQETAVSKVLRHEISCIPSAISSGLDTTKTLEEINLEVLKLVLAEEKGNQSATAKRLGISRTTLWRMIQNIELPI